MKKQLISIILLCFLSGYSFSQISTSSENLEKHVYILASDSLMGRGFGAEGGEQAAFYIVESFKEAGIKPLQKNYFHHFNYRTGILNIDGTNIVGWVEGSDPALKNEYIVLGAHYDHLGWKVDGSDTVVYNGADDNASGTASIIEIGRSLVANRDRLKRSVILVAFDGEESGLCGSERFLYDSIVDPQQIKAMFSLDMIGMYEESGGVQMKGMGTLDNGMDLMERVREKYPVEVTKTSKSIPIRTDTGPFGAKGIPSIQATTGFRSSPYHKPEDDSDKLEYDGMVKICDFVTELTLELSNEPELVAISNIEKEGEDKKQVFHLGLRVNTGTNLHNYKDDYFKAKCVFAGSAGLFVQLRLNEYLSLQPEVLYEWKGSQHELGTIRTHSVTTPLSVMVTSKDNFGFRTYVQVGGYYCYTFDGKIDDTALDFDTEYSEHGAGILYGFGFEAMMMRIGCYFRNGFTNILQDDSLGKITNEGFYVSLGYVF